MNNAGKTTKNAKVALVTGGNSGIGEAIVRALARGGWRLVVAGRRQPENEKVAADVAREFGVEAMPRAGDVSREADCLNLIQDTVSSWGRLDLLVNNAGIGGGGKIAESSTEDFDRVVRTNLYSTYWCSREAYRHMTTQPVDTDSGLRGAIINISSLCGIEAWAGSGIYCASKHGVMGLSRAMADEGGQDLIRVAAICPAMVATPMTGVAGPDYIAPDDIASTVVYLLGLTSAAWPVEVVVRRRGAD